MIGKLSKWKLASLLIFIGVVAYVCMAALTAKKMARADRVRANVTWLANYVEEFRKDHGVYPESVDELISGFDPDLRAGLESQLHDSFGDTFTYQRLTNGFRFVAVGPSSWFFRWQTLTQDYQPGDASKEIITTVHEGTNTNAR